MPITISPARFVVRGESLYVAFDPVVGDPGQTPTVDAVHVANIAAGAHVSGVVDEGDEVDNVRAACFTGRGKAVTDPALVDELLDRSAEKYFYVGHPHLEYYFSTGAVRARVWCELVPDKVSGWDLRDLPQPPISDLLTFPDHLKSQSEHPGQ
ncbi:hypothetical protein CYJ73_18595 [Gordonia terrae]|uniref:Uncharacterized protein n=2 Tax=Gordonia terrae TaxID=2055 RepID=A0A2I1R4T3_9ACTN|nr:hypothetical protein CYJ73_18595 [Gordonia terrae]